MTDYLCKYYICSEHISGWIDADTPKIEFVMHCDAQKGSPEVCCGGVEKLCKCGRYKPKEN